VINITDHSNACYQRAMTDGLGCTCGIEPLGTPVITLALLERIARCMSDTLAPDAIQTSET